LGYSYVLFLSFSIAGGCLTPTSRRGGVGQASVPSLDVQVAESRRGLVRRVAGFLFSAFLVSTFLSFFFLSPSFFPFRFSSQPKNQKKHLCLL